jgi:NodT family efflux transporter outer membrane factor (OMF) lipoprotein
MKFLNKYSAAVIILMAAQLLVACNVTKDVSVPDTALPNAFRNAPVDTNSIAALPWKSFFEDAELKSLINDALEHNYDLQVAVKNIEAAELAFKQAKLGNIPSVELQATASTSRPSDNSLNGLSLNQYLGTKHIEDYTIAASLSWEADIWGKIRSQKAATYASFLSTREARKAVQTKIVNDVSKGYYNLLMLDAQLQIAEKNVKLNDSTLNIINLQYQAGQVTSLAVQQAQAQKLTAEGLVPQFEQQIAVQENAISVLSGRLPNRVNRDIALESLNITDKLSTGMPSELLGRRPDVRQAELALSRANANVGYAQANMYPSLTITAQGGLDAIKASNWFNIPASLFGAVAGGIAQPLFAQKRLNTAYKVAKVDRDITVIQFRQSVLVAYGEVSDALVKIDKLKQQQDLVTNRTETLQLATHNSQLLFKNGLATYLEVITAQGNVLQSELELATIKKERLDATVDLYRSLGGGWQ